MPDKDYELDGNTLVLLSRDGLKKYCLENGISRDEFNQPVIISESI